MTRIGIAQTDITPKKSVWLTGYGNRDHKSTGVYQALIAGAISIQGDTDETLIITADLIGYSLAYSAAAKMNIAQATGLAPHQIVLTATHTHCAPFFYPWAMPGAIEHDYAHFLHDQLVHLAVAARAQAVEGKIAFSRGTSTFGVSRRLPDGKGGILFAPNPDGPMDRALDTLWFTDTNDRPLGSLTVFGCHPTSIGGYLIGGDYPGFLCRAVAKETGAPAFFTTGCAGNIRPWFKEEGKEGFLVPTHTELAIASAAMAQEVLACQKDANPLPASTLRTTTDFHPLPYADIPDESFFATTATDDDNPLRRQWAQAMLTLSRAGALPESCPQEIQIIEFNKEMRAVFLGGEVLTEIGLHIKESLTPATTITAAYSNGLIAYVPGKETYDLGGYEVDGSHPYFLRPAPFSKDIEDRIVSKTAELVGRLQ